MKQEITKFKSVVGGGGGDVLSPKFAIFFGSEIYEYNHTLYSYGIWHTRS
jgi:hypothetical protein